MSTFKLSKKIIICGAGGSGKDYFMNFVKQNYDYNIAIKTTTRPKRPNEKEGIDYFYLKNEQLKNVNLVISQKFTINNTHWTYGFKMEDIDNADILMLTPIEINKLLQIKDRNDFYIVYLNISEEVRKLRMINRNDNNDKGFRRVEADNLDFLGFEKICDLEITEVYFDTYKIMCDIEKELKL